MEMKADYVKGKLRWSATCTCSEESLIELELFVRDEIITTANGKSVECVELE
jgi:hypothetical protein